MPHREQGAGQRRERAEVDFTQSSREAGVLHPHFNGQRTTGGLIKAKQFPTPVAAEQANRVMQNNGDNHHKTDRGNVRS